MSSKIIGLSSTEAAVRLKKFGYNKVSGEKPFLPLLVFLEKFTSPLFVILLVAATLSFFLHQRTSAIIIYVMVFISALLDFYSTYHSHQATEALSRRVHTKAYVWRDNNRLEISIKELIPGDLVELAAGDIIPADCLVLESKDFFVDQSALTGESFPVGKVAASDFNQSDLPRELAVDNQSHVFMGTSAITGIAKVLVIHTGPRTTIGQIASSLSAPTPPTDFEKGITQFSYFIMKLAVVMIIFVFVTNTIMGRGALTSLLFAVAVAVGVTPELLPVIMTVSLSHGALKMARKKVIVKRLAAIQNFGNMTVLCTDKTGTLTRNAISLIKYVNTMGQVSEEVLYYAYLTSHYHSGIANPLDAAVVNYRHFALDGTTKVDLIPFDFLRKRSSVVVKNRLDEEIIITKGAPEDVLAVATKVRQNSRDVRLTKQKRTAIERIYESISQEGYRVLAVAIKKVTTRPASYDVDDERELTIIGLIAFLDPPKTDAGVVIHKMIDFGVETKILTGDSEVLTAKIAQAVGLPVRGVLIGSDIAKLADVDLQRLAPRTTIFARVNPSQKERVIKALQAGGAVVGYLGDGINDAPALKAADVGISVNNAVDIAKETADIILLRKSLTVLLDGIIDGRQTFQNSQKYILMGLSSNFGNMFSMMAISAFAPFLPMLPVQILLNNFLYDMSQTSIPTDNVDEEELRRPPKWDITFIKKFMLSFGLVSSLFDFITFALLLWVFRFPEHAFQTGWFIESLTTQVLVVYIIRTKKTPLWQSWPSRWLALTSIGAVAVAWIIPHTKIGAWFELVPLQGSLLGVLLVLVITYLIFAEVAKRVFYQRVFPAT